VKDLAQSCFHMPPLFIRRRGRVPSLPETAAVESSVPHTAAAMTIGVLMITCGKVWFV
jgi:hypothetical protein